MLLELFPEGVEEADDGWAVYTDETGEAALRSRFSIRTSGVGEGWEDAWRAFHRGVVVGRFWIGPPWETPAHGLEPIVIHPGRAFGTGAHGTTRTCAELLQRLDPTSVLDVGCGSGVLSIAAAKLGFGPIVAIDRDVAAVEATHENARVNGVEVEVRSADALDDELPEAGLVLANVELDVVELLLPRLATRRAIVSGFLDCDEPRTPGWRRIERVVRDGWAADLLERS